ncbi:MAG: hypothetical protein V2B18_13500 [Pseudomonadota bacterium]
MARLDDRISADDLLERIRSGALKHELIKDYRTTESELAQMLLPLWRGGRMTKDEFNNFFKPDRTPPKESPGTFGRFFSRISSGAGSEEAKDSPKPETEEAREPEERAPVEGPSAEVPVTAQPTEDENLTAEQVEEAGATDTSTSTSVTNDIILDDIQDVLRAENEQQVTVNDLMADVPDTLVTIDDEPSLEIGKSESTGEARPDQPEDLPVDIKLEIEESPQEDLPAPAPPDIPPPPPPQPRPAMPSFSFTPAGHLNLGPRIPAPPPPPPVPQSPPEPEPAPQPASDDVLIDDELLDDDILDRDLEVKTTAMLNTGAIPEAPPPPAEPIETVSMESLLRGILDKLESIDARLARFEEENR